MNNEVNWSFPTTGGGKKTGFNESGIQFFNDDTLLSLAREICQNSLDAKKDTNNDPVTVVFRSFRLKKEDIMGKKIFSDILDKEIEYAKKYYKNDKTPINFYSEAKKLLESDELLCLRVSDFNTSGLTGSDREIDSKWDRLVKSEGFSDNPTTSGGSFGIGKNAAFACSKLHTVFYSTLDEKGLVASQGVSKLSSCELDDGNITQGTGYYGVIKNTEFGIRLDSMNEQLFIDPSFDDRKESGTDIYILGFDDRNKSNEIPDDDNEGWVIDVAASIIDNYFVSILDKKLIVKINDLELNNKTISERFGFIYSNNSDMFNQYTIDYFDILASDKYETKHETFSMFEPDDVSFDIAFDPNFKNRVGIIKGTGMKIFDKDKLPQISFYCGVLKLVGKEVNAYFRQMENPKHDEWYPSKMDDEKTARKEYNKLFDFVRATIRKYVESSIPESMDAEGVGEFLPDEFDDGSNNEPTENIVDDILEEIEVKENPIVKNDNINIEDENQDDDSAGGQAYADGEEEGNYGQVDPNESDGGKGTPGSANNDKGTIDVPSGKNVLTTKSRCMYTNGKYEFMFVSPIDLQNAKITVEIAGELVNYKPEIIEASGERRLFSGSGVKFNGNIIEVGKVNKNEPKRIQFTLKETENWALEVKVYEN